MSIERPVRYGLALIAVVLSPPGSSATFALEPGRYDITTQMVMPHLDAMRHIVKQEQLCVEESNPVALFPVMRQPALRGCTLDYEVERGVAFAYVLVCQSARVATGSARLNRAANAHINGTLDVKMGGKNMTFSQHIEAVRQGECSRTE